MYKIITFPVSRFELIFTFILFLSACMSTAQIDHRMDRRIPVPLPHHPGNIFLAGENVNVPLTVEKNWTVINYDGKTVAQGKVQNGRAELGKLPTGYYELHVDGIRYTTIGVLVPLIEPTPQSSPISIDVAMAWFYNKAEQPEVANLCTLAGINWVRDRLSWNEMEPVKGRFVNSSKYDDTANCQSTARLNVLQVHHTSPSWSNRDSKRFPPDLRDAFAFQRQMALRWKGKVSAFEPWNEADIEGFGGHTGAEMAALQKASYLGLKAGNPDVIACMNVFALPQSDILADLNDNHVYPYFDTFNFHHYADTDAYPGIYEKFRNVAAGRPLWVTECNVPVHWSGDDQKQEPGKADLLLQAERVAKVYATSLAEGSAQVFYFMLPHYVEGKTQYGVLHKDLTPRPAFLAIAACGRLLAGAVFLGRLPASSLRVTPAGKAANAFVFRARPDGQERDVLVAWTDGTGTHLNISSSLAVYDNLGRKKNTDTGIILTPSPIFAVFPKDTFSGKMLQIPQPAPTPAKGEPSHVVFQSLWPKENVSLSLSAYRISSEKRVSIPIFVYNFGTNTVKGTLGVKAPTGWIVKLPPRIKVKPGERKKLIMNVDCQTGSDALTETVCISSDFGGGISPVLSLRLMPHPSKLRVRSSQPLPQASQVVRWKPLVSQGGKMKLSAASSGGVLVDAKFGKGERWTYPIFQLRAEERPSKDIDALQFTLTAQKGDGIFRAIFDEDNGSSYVADLIVQPKPGGKSIEAIALLDGSIHGAVWSKIDPNGKLDADKIKAVKIGCNTSSGHVIFCIDNLRWIKLGTTDRKAGNE